MKPTIHCITIAVENVIRSYQFYRDGFDLSADVPDENADHVAFTFEGQLFMVIILREEFSRFAVMAGNKIADKGSSECILTYFAGSKEEVDQVIKKAVAVGAVNSTEPCQQPWGYAGYFSDPDGHIWEIMWNPGLNNSVG